MLFIPARPFRIKIIAVKISVVYHNYLWLKTWLPDDFLLNAPFGYVSIQPSLPLSSGSPRNLANKEHVTVQNLFQTADFSHEPWHFSDVALKQTCNGSWSPPNELQTPILRALIYCGYLLEHTPQFCCGVLSEIFIINDMYWGSHVEPVNIEVAPENCPSGNEGVPLCNKHSYVVKHFILFYIMTFLTCRSIEVNKGKKIQLFLEFFLFEYFSLSK